MKICASVSAFALLLAASTILAPASGETQPNRPKLDATERAQPEPAAGPRIQDVEEDNRRLTTELQGERSKQELLRIKSEIQDASYARLEVLIGIFGVLLTVLVIAFGFRTAQAAAQAARAELADRRKELDEIIQQAKAAAEAARAAAAAADAAHQSAASAATAVEGHAASVAAHAAEASARMAAIRESAKSSLPAEAFEQSTSPIGEKVRDIFAEARDGLVQALAQKDYPEVKRLAEVILTAENATEYDIAYGTYFKRSAEAKLHNDENEEVRAYTEVIDAFKESADSKVRNLVAVTYINRGLTYANLDEPKKEDEDYNTVIELYTNETDPQIRKQVGEAYYWKAANLATKGRVEKPIALLTKWAVYNGSFDCAEIVDSIFFKHILNNRMFKNFLREMGCDCPPPEGAPEVEA